MNEQQRMTADDDNAEQTWAVDVSAIGAAVGLPEEQMAEDLASVLPEAGGAIVPDADAAEPPAEAEGGGGLLHPNVPRSDAAVVPEEEDVGRVFTVQGIHRLDNRSFLHLPHLPSGITEVTFSEVQRAPPVPAQQPLAESAQEQEQEPTVEWIEAQVISSDRVEDDPEDGRPIAVEPASGEPADMLVFRCRPTPESTAALGDSDGHKGAAPDDGAAGVPARRLSLSSRRPTTASVPDAEKVVAMKIERKVPIIGWAILTVAVLCMSSTDMGFHVLGDEATLLTRLSWRFICTTLILAPWAITRFVASQNVRNSLGSPTRVLLVGCAAVGWWFHFGTFVVALHMTRASLALLFNNMTPILLLSLRLIRREPILLSEGAGALVALAGLIVITLSAPAPAAGAEHEAADSSKKNLGCLIALSGTLGSVMYLFACKRLRPVMEPAVQFALIAFGAWALTIPVLLLGPARAPLGIEPTGVFGFLMPRKLPVALGAALFVEVLGNLGFVVALKYISPLVVSVLALLGPVIASAENVWWRHMSPPTPLACVGMLVTIVGTAVVIAGSSASTTKVQVALQQVQPQLQEQQHATAKQY